MPARITVILSRRARDRGSPRGSSSCSSGGNPRRPSLPPSATISTRTSPSSDQSSRRNAAGRGVAGHAGVDDVVVEAALLQLLADQRRKTLIRRQAETGRQAVAEKHDAGLRCGARVQRVPRVRAGAERRCAVSRRRVGRRNQHASGNRRTDGRRRIASRNVDDERRRVVGRAARDRFVHERRRRHPAADDAPASRLVSAALSSLPCTPSVHSTNRSPATSCSSRDAGLHIVLGADHAGQHVTQRMLRVRVLGLLLAKHRRQPRIVLRQLLERAAAKR